MRRLVGWAGTAAFLAVIAPAQALAGMPAVKLNDLAKLRIEAISFFAVLLLLSALGVQWLWNRLRRDFEKLPRLGYGRALLLVVAWGLAFNLVLVMIAGARELMTPGAWERDGITYRLSEPEASVAGDDSDASASSVSSDDGGGAGAGNAPSAGDRGAAP